MEGGVEVVVEWEAPFQGGRRGVVVGGEEVGEGFNLGAAEVEKAVVEDAEKPHPLPTINYTCITAYTWDGIGVGPTAQGGGGRRRRRTKGQRCGKLKIWRLQPRQLGLYVIDLKTFVILINMYLINGQKYNHQICSFPILG